MRQDNSDTVFHFFPFRRAHNDMWSLFFSFDFLFVWPNFVDTKNLVFFFFFIPFLLTYSSQWQAWKLASVMNRLITHYQCRLAASNLIDIILLTTDWNDRVAALTTGFKEKWVQKYYLANGFRYNRIDSKFIQHSETILSLWLSAGLFHGQ